MRLKHSATTPWPAKAASPCISSGSTWPRPALGVSRRVKACLARALPSTTGLTISRWLGLAVSDRWTLLPSNSRSELGAQVVLHVARALDVLGHGRAALELVEDRAVGLAHHRGQDVQPAAVGHAEDDLVNAQGAAPLDDLLERRHRQLAAVEAEPLRSRIPRARKRSKPSASISFLRMAILPSLVKLISLSRPSIRRCSQAFSAGSEMCMYCTPSVLQ